MPLTATRMKHATHDDRHSIGFWMTVVGTDEPIRVFVTYKALWQIDPSHPQDVPTAIGIFNENRSQIEAAASNKFDTDGADDGKYEGQPILFVRSNELS
jgi:Protein of unknown function (DUF1488)